MDLEDRPRHRWYFFKEAFSPDVVDRAIADAGYGPSTKIVDPFCGSGTVPVQAALSGLFATGFEVNPFLAFVSKAKLSNCSVRVFEKRRKEVVSAAQQGRASPLFQFSTFSNGGYRADGSKNKKWLFNRSVLEAYEGGSHLIRASDTPADRLLKLCLLGAAADVCNATKDGKALRYRTDWQDRKFCSKDFVCALESRVRKVATDLVETNLSSKCGSVRLMDSRTRAPHDRFNLCITSPPYLNSFDYTDVYRPELFLGGWVNSMEDLRKLRLRTLRSHLQVGWSDPTEERFGAHYDEVIARIKPLKEQLWNHRIPLMVQAYFEDMRRVFLRLRSAAAENAAIWMVVSTSAYAGIEIPVDLILADIATTCGWHLREVRVVRYLSRVAGQQWNELAERSPRSSPHLRESVVIWDIDSDYRIRSLGQR